MKNSRLFWNVLVGAAAAGAAAAIWVIQHRRKQARAKAKLKKTTKKIRKGIKKARGGKVGKTVASKARTTRSKVVTGHN